MNALTWVLR